MINSNRSNGNGKKTVTFKASAAKLPDRTRQARNMRQKVFDLKQIMIDALEPEEWFCMVRDIIDLANAGNREAVTWIADRIIGKPTQTIDLNDFTDEAAEQPPKVVLLDWRRNGLDSSAESN